MRRVVVATHIEDPFYKMWRKNVNWQRKAVTPEESFHGAAGVIQGLHLRCEP
jgi:hypothetical protein